MNFKTLTLAALAAASTLAGAGAASAQEFGWRPEPRPVDFGYGRGGDFGGGFELRAREDGLQRWIEASARDGRLSFWRARRAQAALDAIRRDQHEAWEVDGALSPWRAARLNGRLDQLAGFIRASQEGYGYAPPRW